MQDQTHAAASGPPPPARQRCGRYLIRREIARGGMGVVYLAHDPNLGRDCALKILLAANYGDPELIERFVREAKALGRLRHPDIIDVYESGFEGGKPFLVMELVEGGSLQDLLAARGGRLEVEDALRLMDRIARAIDFAHGEGILHRDLKPANVLLDREGRPRVTDFGLARDLDARSSLTKSGQVMGTLHYMPPEQANGELDALGPPADVYSLGVMLYELLSGTRPFGDREGPSLLAAIVMKRPEPLRSHCPELPRDLTAIVEVAMAREPADRYESAAALAADIRCYLDGRTVHARERTFLGHAFLAAQQHKVIVLALAVGLALLVGLPWVVAGRRAAVAGPVTPPASEPRPTTTDARPPDPLAELAHRADAHDAAGAVASAEEVRFELLRAGLRADRSEGSIAHVALARIVAGRLERGELATLLRGWSELHPHLRDDGRCAQELLEADDVRIERALADPDARPADRIAAAIGAAAIPSRAARVLLRDPPGAGPLLGEAARASRLADSTLLDLETWGEAVSDAEPFADDGAAAALTLFERAFSLRSNETALLERLARAPGRVLRAATAIAIAGAAAAGRLRETDARALLEGMATRGQDDALVEGRVDAVRGALDILWRDEPRRIDEEAVVLAFALLDVPGREARDRPEQRRRALAVLDDLCGVADPAPRLLALRARLALEDGRRDAALADLDRVAARDADHPDVLTIAAIARPGAAASPIERLARIDPAGARRVARAAALGERFGVVATPVGGDVVRIVLALARGERADALDRSGLDRAFDLLASVDDETRVDRDGLSTRGLAMMVSRFALRETDAVTLEVDDAVMATSFHLWFGAGVDWSRHATGWKASVSSVVRPGITTDGGPRRIENARTLEAPIRTASLVLGRTRLRAYDRSRLAASNTPRRRRRGGDRIYANWGWRSIRDWRFTRVTVVGIPGVPADAPVIAPGAWTPVIREKAGVVAEGIDRAPASLDALRSDGVRLPAVGEWVNGERDASIVSVPGLEGDVRVSALCTHESARGVHAGIALEDEEGGAIVRLGPGSSERVWLYVQARHAGQHLPIASVAWDGEPIELVLERRGDRIFATAGAGATARSLVGDDGLPWRIDDPVSAAVFVRGESAGASARFDAFEVETAR